MINFIIANKVFIGMVNATNKNTEIIFCNLKRGEVNAIYIC